jgi:hypothetical protein
MKLVPRLAIAAILALPAAAQPQEGPPPVVGAGAERRWSVSLGTGAGGFVEFVDAFAGSSIGPYDTSRREERIQLNGRLDRAQGRWLRTGIAWVYNGWTEAFFAGGARVGEIENSVHALMLDATIPWLRRDHVELYSALAAGAGRWRQRGSGIASGRDEVSSGFAFQLRYLGIAVGSDRLRAFVDLGIGFEGLIVGGATLRF